MTIGQIIWNIKGCWEGVFKMEIRLSRKVGERLMRWIFIA